MHISESEGEISLWCHHSVDMGLWPADGLEIDLVAVSRYNAAVGGLFVEPSKCVRIVNCMLSVHLLDVSKWRWGCVLAFFFVQAVLHVVFSPVEITRLGDGSVSVVELVASDNGIAVLSHGFGLSNAEGLELDVGGLLH